MILTQSARQSLSQSLASCVEGGNVLPVAFLGEDGAFSSGGRASASPNVQADYAKRVSGYIERASTTDGVGALERLPLLPWKSGQHSRQGSSPMDQRLVCPLAEAWCVARFALYNGSLSRQSAMAVIAAIEAFALERPAYLTTVAVGDGLAG